MTERICSWSGCSEVIRRAPNRGTPFKYCSDKCKLAAKAAAKRQWRQENPEKYRESQARYRARNQDLIADRTKRWAEANPDALLQHKLKRYNITVADYRLLLADQDNRCAICGTSESGRKRWSVDHDHSCCPANSSCGECIRGLLCGRCNVGLGNFLDDPVRLRAAISYLERHSA